MKFTIILKQQDADGLGGEILEAMGMERSEHAPTVFMRTLATHNVSTMGTGDNSWSQPEAHTVTYVEALTDAGIRPVRVFQKTDTSSGLTPLHASAWSDSKGESKVADQAQKHIFAASIALKDSSPSIALKHLVRAVRTLKNGQ